MGDRIKMINKADLNLDMVYYNKADATNLTNNKTAIENILEDELEVTFDANGIGIVRNKGVPVYFVNESNYLKKVRSDVDSLREETIGIKNKNAQDNVNKTLNDRLVQADLKSMQNESMSAKKEASYEQPVKKVEAQETLVTVEKKSEANMSSNTSNTELEFDTDSFLSSVKKEGGSSPEDFSFRFSESNNLAAMARDMGYTDEQIKLAVGISREETGNYGRNAGGDMSLNHNNFGGVKAAGDLGVDKDGYGIYSTEELGMEAFLKNLKKNYLDLGMTTPEQIARKYLGHDNTSTWIKEVHGCMR